MTQYEHCSAFSLRVKRKWGPAWRAVLVMSVYKVKDAWRPLIVIFKKRINKLDEMLSSNGLQIHDQRCRISKRRALLLLDDTIHVFKGREIRTRHFFHSKHKHFTHSKKFPNNVKYQNLRYLLCVSFGYEYKKGYRSEIKD